MFNKVQETVKFLKDKGLSNPDFGIVLGTGLGSLANIIDVKIKIEYNSAEQKMKNK